LKTRVFLLRHAESADPTVFHGAESDIGLSPRGERQAAAIARILAGHGLHAVISSAMCRAVLTARPIAEAAGVPHLFEPALHERRVGILSGKPFGEGGIWAETQRRWSRGEADYAHEGAESWTALRGRIVPAWSHICVAHAGKTVAVVAHGIVCKVILLHLFPSFTWETIGSTRNVALNELHHSPAGWTLACRDELPSEVFQSEAGK
jgi:2,3-bisphosphoglycerate-dependent phosphoglycerate mutase